MKKYLSIALILVGCSHNNSGEVFVHGNHAYHEGDSYRNGVIGHWVPYDRHYKIPDDTHIGYDSIEIVDWADEPFINFCYPRHDTVRASHDAFIMISDSSVAFRIDSVTSLVEYYDTNHSHTGFHSMSFGKGDNLFSTDSVNFKVNGKHVIVTTIKP